MKWHWTQFKPEWGQVRFESPSLTPICGGEVKGPVLQPLHPLHPLHRPARAEEDVPDGEGGEPETQNLFLFTNLIIVYTNFIVICGSLNIRQTK